MVDVIEPMAFDDVMFRVVALTLARSLAYGVGRAFAKSRRRGGRCDRDSAGVTGGGQRGWARMRQKGKRETAAGEPAARDADAIAGTCFCSTHARIIEGRGRWARRRAPAARSATTRKTLAAGFLPSGGQ
jgi:hypothetical protein